jgi:hypothetical protein
VFVECLGWCLAFQRLAGSAIHGCGDGLEVVAVPPREIGAFREVLAERALVFSFVPRWTNMTAKRMKLPYCGGRGSSQPICLERGKRYISSPKRIEL